MQKGGKVKLEKAIGILTDLLGEEPQYPPDDRRDAVKLGRAALRRVEDSRVQRLADFTNPLLGETED